MVWGRTAVREHVVRELEPALNWSVSQSLVHLPALLTPQLLGAPKMAGQNWPPTFVLPNA